MIALPQLRQYMLVQRAAADVAAAFASLQGADILARRFDRPASIQRIGLFVLAFVPNRERRLSGDLIEGSDWRLLAASGRSGSAA